MSEPKWNKAKAVTLTKHLIATASEDRASDRVQEIQNAEFAIEGGFLYIKPEGSASLVTVVPVATLERLTYENSTSAKSWVMYR